MHLMVQLIGLAAPVRPLLCCTDSAMLRDVQLLAQPTVTSCTPAPCSNEGTPHSVSNTAEKRWTVACKQVLCMKHTIWHTALPV